jgi:sodium/potassium-transporting ATPase subunit alpha
VPSHTFDHLTFKKTVNEIIPLFVNGFLVIIVANVPQGLPGTVTSLLSLAARRMALQAVLVKRIDCVETLGSTSIICSDKTGTLTKNEMTVTDVWYNQELVRRHRKSFESIDGQEPQAVLFRVASLCNRAKDVDDHNVDDSGFFGESASQRQSQRQSLVELDESQQRRIKSVSSLSWGGSVRQSSKGLEALMNAAPKFIGNPSDVALVTYCDRFVSVRNLRTAYPILFEVPFNSTNKWQLVVVKSRVAGSESDEEADYEILMKGAPEVILDKCSTFASKKDASHQMPVDFKFKEQFTQAYEGFASQGRRVLATCSLTFRAKKGFQFEAKEDNTYNFPTKDFNFIGLLAVMDPPRDNVPDAIKECHSAG